MSDVQERIQELQNKIVAVCLGCPHVKRWMAGSFRCTVKRSHCHSKRVRNWLNEIDKLEGEQDSGIHSKQVL